MAKKKTPELTEDRVRELIREVVGEILSERPRGEAGREDLPRPRKKGRKEDRRYSKITATIDEKLAQRFRDEAASAGLSYGKLLDRILWARYGKPPLSYETATPFPLPANADRA